MGADLSSTILHEGNGERGLACVRDRRGCRRRSPTADVRHQLPLRQLGNATHHIRGILGYGCIGRQCARVATALGMEIYAFTHRPRTTPSSRRDESYHEPGMGDEDGILPSQWFSGATQEAVDDFISQDLDILVIAMPLTPLTTNMISTPQFKLMAKKKTFLSNIGRGKIVDTEALMAALDGGLIRGAALDVTEPEPLPKGHPLWKKENLIITPHTSGNSNHYNERVLAILEYNLERMGRGEGLVNRVDKELGY